VKFSYVIKKREKEKERKKQVDVVTRHTRRAVTIRNWLLANPDRIMH